MTENNEWISVYVELPKKAGWYLVKTLQGEFEAPFVSTLAGNMVWLLPDPSVITHWKNK